MHWLAYMQDWVDLLKRSCGLNLRIQFKKYKFYIVNRKQHISGISLYCSQNITQREKETHSAKSQCIIIIEPRQTFASQTLGQDQLVLGLGGEKDPPPPSPFQLQLTIGRVLSTQKGECQQSKVWYSAQHRGVLIVSLNIEHLLVQLLVHCWPEKFGKHWTHHWFMLLLQVVVCQCFTYFKPFFCVIFHECKIAFAELCIVKPCVMKCVCVWLCVRVTVCVCVCDSMQLHKANEWKDAWQAESNWLVSPLCCNCRSRCLSGQSVFHSMQNSVFHVVSYRVCSTVTVWQCHSVTLWRSCTRFTGEYLSTMSRADGAACLKYPQNM